jgi:hypothetical protein
VRPLNDRALAAPAGARVRAAETRGGTDLVFLSQTFAGLGDVIADNEARVVARLNDAFAGAKGIRLFYKPHPNSKDPKAPPGFVGLTTLEAVNGGPGTLFVSFFSTCQIDPAFKGRKVLLRGDLIHPEIAFDESETILDLAGLIDLLRQRLPEAPSQPLPLPAATGTASVAALDGRWP